MLNLDLARSLLSVSKAAIGKMPDIETIQRFQDAVYWAKSDDDRYGSPKVVAAIALRVRWEQKQAEMLSPQGETISVDAQVVADRALVMGSIMWLGRLVSLGTPPTPTSDIFQAVAYDDVPDVDNLYIRRTYGLKRYTDALPEVV